MAKAKPTAAAIAATIRAILIPTPDAAHRGIKKGRQMTREYRALTLEMGLSYFSKKGSHIQQVIADN
ncbi:hypothetical protein [Actinophytocola sp. NPDC049390]|uniref:hypothetical protein n=1 Tax=Actinophytocola sp. NPDC049390 TaxID=3363894 RepID=UPI0037ACF7D2